MLTKFRQACKREEGFTLIELMIVVAIIGILAAVAVPNFIAYRNKSKISSVMGTAEGIRAAFANYAADSDGNLYPDPDDITADDIDSLAAVVNPNGGSLRSNDTAMDAMSMKAFTYVSSNQESYTLTITVDVVGDPKIDVTPSGIVKQQP